MMSRRYAAIVLLSTVPMACGDGTGGNERSAEREGDAAAPVTRVVELTAGEALAILGAVHQGSAAFAAAAADSVADAELRRLLRVMRVDHEALQAELSAIADSLGVTPATHPEAERVRSAAREATVTLSTAAGGGDQAILQRQIEFQESVLNLLDSTVVPGTREPLLTRFVAAARPTLGAHLQRAHQVETLVRERGSRPAAGITPSAPTPAPATPPTETQPEPEPEPAEPDPEPAPPDTVPGRA